MTSKALAAARAAGFLAWTAGMTGAAEVRARRAPPGEGAAIWRRMVPQWARGLLRLFAVELRADGPPPAEPPPGRGRLIVASHRSPLDIPILLGRHGGRTLSRADLADWPIVGRAARGAGTVFVDRESERSGMAALRAVRTMLAAGETVIVFPEGGTSGGDEVKPFHRGAFAAARGLDVDLVAVGLAYEPGTEFVEDKFLDHLARVAGRPRLRVGLCTGPPRALPAGRSEDAALAMHAEVQRLVRQARALV